MLRCCDAAMAVAVAVMLQPLQAIYLAASTKGIRRLYKIV